MEVDEAFDDGKTEARAGAPAALAVGGEAVEHGRQHVGRHAAAIVVNGEDEIAVFAPALHFNGGSFRREIDCVGQDLDEDLLQSLLVRDDMTELS